MTFSRRIEEEILLLKIRRGDQAAYAQVYDRYVDALYRFVTFRVRTPELAQDITSELFLRVWQHITGGTSKVNNIRAYLYQVARNLIADHYRGQEELLGLDEMIAAPASSTTGQAQLERRVALADVERALTNMRGDWQELVLLAHVEGLKPQEIALIIGKSRAATRVMLHRAMAELKRLLHQGS